jgi:hypothetical protein
MDCCKKDGDVIWGMGLIGLLIAIVLVLGIALVKYIRSS